MASGEIIITGSVESDAASWDALVAVALEHVRRSRTEPGCLSHDVFTSVEAPHRLFFFERWQDQAAVDAHFGRVESQAFVKQLMTLASKPPTMQVDTLG